jgi:hypothetical protein
LRAATPKIRDTKDKGRTEKSWKASFGKPYFSGRAKHTLGIWTEAPIFTWIIIQNRNRTVRAWKTVGKDWGTEAASRRPILEKNTVKQKILYNQNFHQYVLKIAIIN